MSLNLSLAPPAHGVVFWSAVLATLAAFVPFARALVVRFSMKIRSVVGAVWFLAFVYAGACVASSDSVSGQQQYGAVIVGLAAGLLGALAICVDESKKRPFSESSVVTDCRQILG